MTAMQLIKVYALTLLVFLALDFLWLGLLARQFYQRHLGHLFGDQVNWAAAFLFYLLFILGMMVFVIHPGMMMGSAMQVLWKGMLYGLVTYATFDLTNLALIKGWPATVVVVDIIWGIVLSGTVSTSGYGIARWLS